MAGPAAAGQIKMKLTSVRRKISLKQWRRTGPGFLCSTVRPPRAHLNLPLLQAMIQPGDDIKSTVPAVAIGFDASCTRRKTFEGHRAPSHMPSISLKLRSQCDRCGLGRRRYGIDWRHRIVHI